MYVKQAIRIPCFGRRDNLDTVFWQDRQSGFGQPYSPDTAFGQTIWIPCFGQIIRTSCFSQTDNQDTRVFWPDRQSGHGVLAGKTIRSPDTVFWPNNPNTCVLARQTIRTPCFGWTSRTPWFARTRIKPMSSFIKMPGIATRIPS